MSDILKELAFQFSHEGMDGSVHPASLGANSIARATNIQIKDQLPTTRAGVRDIPINDPDLIETGAIQGAKFYNPALGQSQQTFAEDESSIMVMASNALYRILVDDRDVRSSSAAAEFIALTTDSENIYHLAWMQQAENYFIVQDGNSKTLIYDGENPAFFSTGFDSADKANSKLANGASAIGYAHGRILQVTERRKILVGDFLHKSDGSAATNILDMTEQSYQISGSFIAPPSSMGDIMALEILPLQDTTHGHTEVISHCANGSFSVDVSLPDRDTWRDRQLTRHVLLKTGARGPYAIALYDGDQFFRSKHGIQTLRSARAEAQREGSPLRPISEGVSTWLDLDHAPFTRFTSLTSWESERRLYCTVSPWVGGPFRGSRGAVVKNFAPRGKEVVNPAWEGLITMPPEFPEIIQFVNGEFNGRDRLFAFCSKRKGLKEFENHLVEFDPGLKDDILADGSRRRISCQIQSRMISAGNFWQSSQYSRGVLSLRSVTGDLDYGVWVRTDTNAPWVFWSGGKIRPEAGTYYSPTPPQDYLRQLGEVPCVENRGRGLQVLIRWKGYAQIEGLRIGGQGEEPGDETRSDEPRDPAELVVNYDDFEYSSLENRWEDDI